MGARIVFVGDDFTGASDSLAAYARRGLRARMVLTDRLETSGELDVLGLPTDLRSLDPDRARAEIARLWARIASEDPGILHFKICSTFDSSLGTGSIGAVASDLIARFAPDVVAIVGGQPGLGRYCAFGTLFARGPDAAIHRIDRHPVMSRHPVTPMAEADLRRHLAAQGLPDLRSIAFTDLSDTPAAVAALREGVVLFDAISGDDLRSIGGILRAAGGRQLLIGARSVADVVAGAELTEVRRPRVPAPASRNVFVFAGSRSETTVAQVAAASDYRVLRLTPEALTRGELVSEASKCLRDGTPVLIHLDPDLDYGLDPDGLADASGVFVASVLGRVDVGFLGLAGGDTSSRIASRLDFDTLDFDESLGAGVCVCVAAHQDPRRDRMRVMLKGGQMGSPDLFDRFLARRTAPT